MSFMNRIGNQFESFGIGSKKDSGQQPPRYYQAPPAQQPSYGYQQPPTQASPYYAATPPAPPTPLYQTPSTPDKPTLPLGWTTLFDQQQQRWYYVEQSTNRTQWEVPTPASPSPPPPPPPPPTVPSDTRPYDMSRDREVGHVPQQPAVNTPQSQGEYPTTGQVGQFHQAQPAQGFSPQPLQPRQPANALHSPGPVVPEAKKSGKGGLMLGVAGGLAAGAVGGALVGGALRRHDDDVYEEGLRDSHDGYGDEDDDY